MTFIEQFAKKIYEAHSELGIFDVAVDSGELDDTKEALEKLGCKVYIEPLRSVLWVSCNGEDPQTAAEIARKNRLDHNDWKA